MIAVLLCASHHQCARQGRCAASTVLTTCLRAPNNSLMTSPKPSPPSLIGNSSRTSARLAFRQPPAIAAAASCAVNVPLNLSGMIKTFSAMPDFQVAARNVQPETRPKGISCQNHPLWQLSVTFYIMNKPKIIAYLKPSCGWSQGVRAIMRKYDLPFEDRDIINDPVQRQEMIEKSGQMLSPCVEVNGKMLPDISGDEVEAYLLANSLVGNSDRQADAPTNQPCAHEMPQSSPLNFRR